MLHGGFAETQCENMVPKACESHLCSLRRRFCLRQRSRFALSSRTLHTKTVPEYTFKIIRVFPHDPNAYTQGLLYKDGYLYEGTGLNGRSSLRKVRLETGEVVQQADLAPEFFGEGIALLGGKIFQLTWKSHTGFIYDARDFHRLGEFSYRGEGWGLTTDGRDLFMSDRTPEIRVLDPATFHEKRRIKVHDGKTPVTELNELEFVGKFLPMSGRPNGSHGFHR